MSSHVLSPDTQAVLLLCGSLGARRNGAAAPLPTVEYSRVAQWLHQRGLRPGDLLSGLPEDLADLPVPRERVAALLERGAALALEVERWTSRGLWVISRGDDAYPRRLKSRLGKLAPPILYGAGDAGLLNAGGLAIVGSRDAEEAAERFASAAAVRCAERGVTVVSGGARGVDSIAMGAAMEAGGPVVGILTEGLDRAATSGRYREALRAGTLVLASPYDPGARFSVGAAMGRNKVVYALSEWGLVVSSAKGSGGTWAGATENLRAGWVPLFVRDDRDVPAGNRALLQVGGIPLGPQEVESGPDLPALLRQRESDAQGRMPLEAHAPLAVLPAPAPATAAREPTTPSDLFDVVWPYIAHLLTTEHSEKEVAAALGLELGQARTWLKRAVELGRAGRQGRPFRYRLSERTESQLQLLEGPSELQGRTSPPSARASRPRTGGKGQKRAGGRRSSSV